MSKIVLLSVAKNSFSLVTERAFDVNLPLFLRLTSNAKPRVLRHAVDQLTAVTTLMRCLVATITEHDLVVLVPPVRQTNITAVAFILKIFVVEQFFIDNILIPLRVVVFEAMLLNILVCKDVCVGNKIALYHITLAFANHVFDKAFDLLPLLFECLFDVEDGHFLVASFYDERSFLPFHRL